MDASIVPGPRLDVPGEEIDARARLVILVHRGQPAALKDAHDEARVLAGLQPKRGSSPAKNG